jgi:hypothetical protein
MTILLSGDLRHGPKKNVAAEHQMRRTIQDLVSSIDPNVRITPEVEDVSSSSKIKKILFHIYFTAFVGNSRRIHRLGI